MEDYDGSESTELSMMQIMHDPATLASPDLLSEVSDMKKDLIKVSVLLTSEKSCSLDARERSDKTEDDEEDEPFEIVEKVKEDLEKVEEILRVETMDQTKREGAIGISVTIDDEEWVLLSETDVEESKRKNITEVQETFIQEVRITRDTKSSSSPKKDMSGMVSYLSSDIEQCLQEPVPFNHPQDVEIVQESFKEVFVARGKHRPAEIKKPVRKRRKEREFASGSSEDDLERMSRSQSEESLDEDAVIGGSEPVFGSVPVSPRVVETPIGSIKDRVKALQMKVEEEKEVESQKWKSQKVNISQGQLYDTETEKSTKLPPKSPKSPKSQTERLEETMSVRELMKAFQTGQDPSKSKSGLFEHKVITAVTSETATSDVMQSQTERLEETMSVRELMKAFQTGQDPSKSKSGLFEHKVITAVTSETATSDVMQVPPTYDNQMTVTTQHLQESAITTVTSEAASSDVMQVPPTYDNQMTVTAQHLQESAITTVTSEAESPIIMQIPPTCDSHLTVTTQGLQERAITTVTSEAATSDVMQVLPTYDNQMTATTQHLQESSITTVTSEAASPIVTQIPPTRDSQLTVTTQDLQERAITTVTFEAASSDIMHVPPTYDNQMTVTTQHLQESAITTVTSEAASSDVMQVPPTCDNQMTLTTQHLQESAITTVTSEAASPVVMQIPPTCDSHLTVTTQDLQERAITTVTSEAATSDVMQVLPTYNNQMTVTTQHLQESAITTVTSDAESPIIMQIPPTCDSHLTVTTQGLQERAITTVTFEAASSDIMHVPPTYDNQMTVSTLHLQEKNVVENKIIQESCFDPNTIQHKPMIDDGETLNEKPLTTLNSTLFTQNKESDPVVTSNIILNFEEESSPEDQISKLTTVDQNRKPSQEQGKFETEEQQISELLGNEDPGLLPEKMFYENNVCQNRKLSVEPQISPERKPSEDFSADIKAELEDSPEYLLFRRRSAEASKRYLMSIDGLSSDDEEQIHQVAVDPSKSNIITAFATAMVQGEPLLKSEIHGASEESPDSDKHEALVDSPGNSIGTRTPRSSTGDSEKHEGLAETPQSSPEILVLSSSTTTEETEVRCQEAKETPYQSILVTSHERAESDKSAQLCSVTTIKSKTESPSSYFKIESPSLFTKIDSSSNDDFEMDSLSPSTKTESPSSANSKAIIQDTITVMKWDSETSAHDMKSDPSCRDTMKPTEFNVITESKMPQHCIHSQDALDRPSSLGSLQPATISDSKTLGRTDSLETTPIREDRSSQKTPDSIEPSPNKESPCQDSLEGSPTGQEYGQLSYIDRIFSTSQAFVSDSRENVEKEIISEQESESSQGSHETPDMQFFSMTLEQKEVLDSEDFDALQRQFTPEEEMFKMAAKIKTFDEMEKDAKVKKVKFDFDCDSKQLKVEVLSPHKSPVDFNTMSTKESEEQYLENLTESGPVLPLQSSWSDDDYDRPELDESPHKVSGVTSEVLETMDKGEQDHTHLKTVDLQTCTDILSLQTHVNKEEDYEQFPSEYHSIVIGETTPEEDLIITSAESKTGTEMDGDVDSKSPGESPTSEKVLELVSSIDIVGTTTAAKEVQNESQTDFCIYEEDNEGKPEEISVSIPRDLVPWSAEVEDDEAFDAQIEAEEQKILALCTDRQSHGTTPDTTPGRTPTEEGTPNPFLFQEGKLFEMTRGGAIDMTKRTIEEEEERLVFFPINEDPSEEFEVSFNASESVAVASFEMTADGLVHQDRYTDEPDAMSDGFSKTETKIVNQEHPEPIEFPIQYEPKSPTEDNGIHEDTLIPNVDTATYTVTRTVYSEQDLESSDSSVEDEQHSVVEMPISTQVSTISPSASAHSVGQEQFQTLPSIFIPFEGIAAEIEDTTSKPKIAVKAASFDQILGQGDSIEQNQRPKSEADIGVSEWSMSVVDDHTNIESNYTKPKTSSSQMPVSPTQAPPQYSASSQPELPAKIFQELYPSRNTECVETKGDRTSVDLGTESSLKAIRPPSVGDEVFESRTYWEDCVETQMQRISDSTTPDQSKVDWHDDADRKEETLAIIADLLGFSWTELAKELEFNEDEIQQVRAENPNSLQEQSHALLQRWVEREGKHATEDTLIKRLTKINRMDIVHLIEIQMHKSIQEQTSRTYAEIERTLDHSEALSSVQEDVDSLRVVRRVETSQRHPPAVSEEDLSVASLLDIPSWAETMGNTHSESIHGDLMEELEINQESFTNPWLFQEVRKESTKESADEEVSAASEEENQVQGDLSDNENACLSSSPVSLRSQSEFHQQSTNKGSQNAFDFSQVSITRFSSGENSVVLPAVEPGHTVPDLLQHTSPVSQEEENQIQEQVSPVYEKSDLESNEKSDLESNEKSLQTFKEAQLFESNKTSNTIQSSSYYESKPCEVNRLVPESNQILGQNISPSLSPHAFVRETDETLSHNAEVNPGLSRVTPDLIKDSPESDQVFFTPETFSDLDPVASLQSLRVVDQNVVESSPTIDSAILQSPTHYEITILNQVQSDTNSSPLQPSEPEVDPRIGPQTDSCEQELYLQLIESPEQKPETIGDHSDDQEDIYCPEAGNVNTQLDSTIEPLIDDSHGFKRELLSQSETDPDLWIQRETAHLSQTSSFCSSDLSPQTPETVIACHHFDFREKSSKLGSATNKEPVAQEAVVSKDLKRPQSESVISDPTQQSEEKHIDRCLSESSEPLVPTLNRNPAVEKPVSQEAVLDLPLSQDGSDKALPSKDSEQLLSETVLACQHFDFNEKSSELGSATTKEPVAQEAVVPKGLKRPQSESFISGVTQQSEKKHIDRCLSESSEPLVPTLNMNPAVERPVSQEAVLDLPLSQDGSDKTLPSKDSKQLLSETVIACQHFDFNEKSSELGSATTKEPVAQEAVVPKGLKQPQSESFISGATQQSEEKDIDRCLSETSEPLVLTLNMNPVVERPVSQEAVLDLPLSQDGSDKALPSKDSEQLLSETVIACQHFDFREKPSELGSATTKKPIAQEAVVSKGLKRPQSESFISGATQQSEEKHIDRCLSETSEPLVLTLNMNPAVEKPVSHEAVLDLPHSQDGSGKALPSKDFKWLQSDSAMSGAISQQSEEKHSDCCLSDSSEPSVFNMNLVLEELKKTVQPEQPLSDQPVNSEVSVSLILGVSQDKFTGELLSIEKTLMESATSQTDLGEHKELEDTDVPKPANTEKPKPKDLLSIDHQHDDSDIEAFFDCKQTISDYSEDDEPWKGTMALSNKVLRSTIHELQQQPNVRSASALSSHESPRLSVRSSDSEDFEDSLIIQEPNDDAEEKVFLSQKSLESSAQFPQELPPRGRAEYNDDDDDDLRREIDDALGVLSDSSDEDVLTTRVVRRRVIIQGDDVPDIPPQSVTEEQYTDAQGNLVVKKVTRKVIRRCVSSDGVETEQVRVEGSAQQPVKAAPGDGYSKVMKRTVLKSEGHETEVTFLEQDGMSASKGESAVGEEVRQVVQTTVVHGEQLEKHEGNTFLATDLPSAQDDFTQGSFSVNVVCASFPQALSYFGAFRKVQIPRVIEQEILQPDGSVIRRTRMQKSRTHRRSVVRDAGGQERVCVEQTDDRSEPHDNLQHHLHHLIHHYCAQND
ncbi:Ankyrin-2 [Anabarilius grahami]|uniref:Ankyrin-2 n=1 Tax=Anabarilius grahami TaxID=495550 RepID=A0A3N0XF16_ANAGA|nr:Ankyrin-2 [Anabarilius grahami]